MTDLPSQAPPLSPLVRGTLAQRLRLGSGLILFVFALAHFLNHALGIWSVEAMDAAQAWRTAVTRFPPVTMLLASALVVHMGLALGKLARRSSWRMPPWEAAQIALGLAIPPWLFAHIAAQYGSYAIVGLPTSYSEVLPILRNVAPQQSALVLLVWLHGCIGLHYWLRLSPGYHRVKAILLVLAVLVPTLALAGFVASGRESERAEARAAEFALYQDAEDPTVADADASRIAIRDAVYRYAGWSAWGIFAVLAGVLVIRIALGRVRKRIRVSYTDGPTVATPPGPTLLEISRMFNIPHASVCGGRARCSTCRVSIVSTARELPPPEGAEIATLRRVRAEDGVRLGCQLRPAGDLTVTRLVQLSQERRAALPGGADEVGVERTLAILFLDIRGFTALSDARLPYDTVFLLNRFFAEAGEAITGSGGWIDKYLGDGLMALFGLNVSAEAGCRDALRAAMQMDAGLERLNAEMGAELAQPLRIGIGLHFGRLVLGRIGHRASAATTVIGAAVNVASRLESLTKEHGVQIIASAPLVEKAGLPTDAFPNTAVTVRGASTEFTVLLIKQGRDLTPFLADAGRRSAA